MRLKVHRDIQIGSVVHPPGSVVDIGNKELCSKLLRAGLATKASRLVEPVEDDFEGDDDVDEGEGDEGGDDEEPKPKRPAKKRSGDARLHAKLDELETL